ncbi:MAG TPA: HNH endonuclease [Candidatus Hodarchaeales archaeon]|nr:HNH endonuclease [Candidatus Hodarchaeales archaeon]
MGLIKRALTFIGKGGYKRYSDSGRLHRVVGEKKIGRKLRRGEVVHHKNRNKRDNRRSNLWVFTGKNGQEKHHATHRRDKKKYGSW